MRWTKFHEGRINQVRTTMKLRFYFAAPFPYLSIGSATTNESVVQLEKGRLIERLTYALSIQLLERSRRNKSSSRDARDGGSPEACSLSVQNRLE